MGQPKISHKEYFYDLPIDLFCVIHPSTREIIEANGAFEYILGWKPTEVVGQSFDAFVNADKAVIEKAFSKIKLGVHSFTFEIEFRSKNNLLRWVDWKCYVDEEKKQIFAIGRDITTHKETQKMLALQSRTDHLTGIADRQTFLTLLQSDLSGAVRYHYPTAVILIDIDHFKEYNIKHGLQKGDDCLKQIATALKTCLRRKTDFLARYENDVFVALLTHNTLEKAVQTAEYLRDNLEKLSVRHNGENIHHGITASLGVAALSETAETEITSDAMLSAAQRALQMSQKRGGNQVNFIDDFK